MPPSPDEGVAPADCDESVAGPRLPLQGWVVAPHEPEFVRAQLRLYRRMLVLAGVGGLAIAGGLTLVLWPQPSPVILAGWLVAVASTMTLSLALRPHRIERRADRARAWNVEEGRRRLRAHRIVAAVHGTAWAGLLPLMHMLPVGPTHDVIAFALVGLLTGAAIILSFDIVACLLFLLPASLPMALHFTLHNDRLGWLGPVALALFATLLAVSAVRGWHGFRAYVDRSRQARDRADQTRLLEQLLHNTPQGIWFLDNDGLTTDLNPAMAGLLGRPAEAVRGRSVFDFFTGEDLATMERQMERHRHGHREGHEIGLARPDGSRVECFNQATPIHDAGGRRIGSVGMWTDLTAMKLSAQALRESQAELKAVLEAFPGYIAAIADTGRYTFVNDAMARLLGRPVQQILGRTLEEVIPERAAHRRAEFLELRQGRVLSDEMRITAPGGGSTFYMQNTRVAGPVDRDGHFICYAFGTDITALKDSEQRLREAKDEAERANRAKSQFMSQMSHELRTPMNAILGFGQLLRADAVHTLAPAQASHVHEMMEAGRHLLNLIDGLLDLARIEAGRLQVHLAPVAVELVIGEALRLVGPQAARQGVRLPPPPAGQLPPVLADHTRLLQVLLNLLGNAIKYNRPEGEIRVEFTDTPTSYEPGADRGELTITIVDEGHGLTVAQRARLFEPFERLGAETSGVEGTGIGLALSRHLVEAMGGSIGVDSEPGVGSRFWVRLPTAAEAARPLARSTSDVRPPTPVPAGLSPVPAGVALGAPAPPLAAPAPKSLLYIEDNPINAMVVRAMVDRLPGVRLEVSEDGASGLQRAAAQPPALVLTDIQMPGIDGFEVLRRLRGNPSLRHIPVVAISADAMPATIARGREAGFDDYLTKPVAMPTLHACITRLLDRSAP